MEPIAYTIVHAIEGRIRIRIFQLETDTTFASQLQQTIEALDFVTSVRVNPLAQSIVISYNSAAISDADFHQGFAKLLNQIAPSVQSATPAPSPIAEPVVPEPCSIPADPIPQAEPAQGMGLEPTAEATPSFAAEIPSPWDLPAVELTVAEAVEVDAGQNNFTNIQSTTESTTESTTSDVLAVDDDRSIAANGLPAETTNIAGISDVTHPLINFIETESPLETVPNAPIDSTLDSSLKATANPQKQPSRSPRKSARKPRKSR